mmetsp:Transcript_30165/g.98596  ORF Transcript_30165/g.98596 Transcript_30165/m.98596 type:complete len:211 (-) Transcript_30165:1190-1822(-)
MKHRPLFYDARVRVRAPARAHGSVAQAMAPRRKLANALWTLVVARCRRRWLASQARLLMTRVSLQGAAERGRPHHQQSAPHHPSWPQCGRARAGHLGVGAPAPDALASRTPRRRHARLALRHHPGAHDCHGGRPCDHPQRCSSCCPPWIASSLRNSHPEIPLRSPPPASQTGCLASRRHPTKCPAAQVGPPASATHALRLARSRGVRSRS